MLDNNRSDEELLYVNQVADEFGIPSGTLRHWRSHDEGPPSFKLTATRGGRVVYRRGDVLKWLADVEQKTRRGTTVAAAD